MVEYKVNSRPVHGPEISVLDGGHWLTWISLWRHFSLHLRTWKFGWPLRSGLSLPPSFPQLIVRTVPIVSA